MKVAILLMNQGRGSGVVAKEHAEYLLSQGHTVHFIHPGMGAGVQGASNKDVDLGHRTMPVHEYLPAAKNNQRAVSAMEFDEAMAYVPAYEHALLQVIDDVDVVIGHHANLPAIATRNVCQQHGKPYVLFLHGTGIEPRHHGLYDDALWKSIESAIEHADGILVTTEYVRDHLVRNMVALPNERFLIQPCGVDTEVFQASNTGNIREKYGLPEQYVICPGALTHVKGPQNIVEASREYADLAPTVFIGDGDLRPELESALGERGRFLGFVSNEDKAQLINAATLLTAAPEKKEHFGIIYVEAMAGNTPVVAYEGGGVNSIVLPQQGVLTDRDPGVLGREVRSLLLDDARRETMGRSCRLRAESVYATDVVGPRLLEWLEGLLNERLEVRG